MVMRAGSAAFSGPLPARGEIPAAFDGPCIPAAFVGRTGPICSLLTPCQPGVPPVSVRRGFRHGLLYRSIAALERAIREFLEAHNAGARPFVWTKTADEILARIGRFVQRTLAAHDG